MQLRRGGVNLNYCTECHYDGEWLAAELAKAEAILRALVEAEDRVCDNTGPSAVAYDAAFDAARRHLNEI